MTVMYRAGYSAVGELTCHQNGSVFEIMIMAENECQNYHHFNE